MMKQDLVDIKGHPGYARVKNTGVILNINKNEIQAARERKEKRLEKDSFISMNDSFANSSDTCLISD